MVDGVSSFVTMADKSKPKNDFKKRKFKTSSIASLVPSLVRKMGGAAEAKKSAHIIRVMNHWPDIIGKDMATRTKPLKIGFKRQKDRKTGEQTSFRVLQIMAEGALGTTIAMRETIILERLNRIFGCDDFKKLDIRHGSVAKIQKTQAPTQEIKYDLDLGEINDPVLKQRLESLGQAVMNSENKKGK